MSLEKPLPPGTEKAKLAQSFHPRLAHGGVASVGKRKTSRPWNPKAPVFLVLTSGRARGGWSLLHRKNRNRIQSMIYRYAERFQVRVYRSNNLGKSIQLLVKAEDRKALADYLRVLAGRIAVSVSGASKGVKRIGKFWDHLVWSKLIAWGAEFSHIRAHIAQATPESLSAGSAWGSLPPPVPD